MSKYPRYADPAAVIFLLLYAADLASVLQLERVYMRYDCMLRKLYRLCREIVRAGIQAVDVGQTEAARSLGLNARQTMIHIVLPQAVKNILPALCNEFVAIVKETSLASTFFIGELMTQFKTINGLTFRVLEPLFRLP